MPVSKPHQAIRYTSLLLVTSCNFPKTCKQLKMLIDPRFRFRKACSLRPQARNPHCLHAYARELSPDRGVRRRAHLRSQGLACRLRGFARDVQCSRARATRIRMAETRSRYLTQQQPDTISQHRIPSPRRNIRRSQLLLGTERRQPVHV